MRVYIYACETTYGGLHGMNNCGVFEVRDIDEANEIGYDMSEGVIESYGLEDEYFEEEELEEGLYSIGEYTDWYVCAIDEEKCKNMSIQELDILTARHDYETFIEEYCLPESL